MAYLSLVISALLSVQSTIAIRKTAQVEEVSAAFDSNGIIGLDTRASNNSSLSEESLHPPLIDLPCRAEWGAGGCPPPATTRVFSQDTVKVAILHGGVYQWLFKGGKPQLFFPITPEYVDGKKFRFPDWVPVPGKWDGVNKYNVREFVGGALAIQVGGDGLESYPLPPRGFQNDFEVVDDRSLLAKVDAKALQALMAKNVDLDQLLIAKKKVANQAYFDESIGLPGAKVVWELENPSHWGEDTQKKSNDQTNVYIFPENSGKGAEVYLSQMAMGAKYPPGYAAIPGKPAVAYDPCTPEAVPEVYQQSPAAMAQIKALWLAHCEAGWPF